MEFQIDINNVNLIQHDQVESGEYNVTECQFTFSNEFDGLTKKAVFTGEDGTAYLQTIVDNKCSIPSEILEVSQVVEIGVYAYAVENEELILRYSPEPTDFFIHEGSYKEAQNSTPPTPSEIEQLQAQITENANDIDVLEGNILNLQEEQVEQNRNIQANADDIEEIQQEQITQNTNIQKNTDDIVNINQAIDTINTDIANIDSAINDINQNIDDLEQDLTNYSLITETGSQINLNVNSTNYQITAILKDKNGNVIYTSNAIDLPIESMIVNATYDNTTKEIVLTLQNGQTLRFSIADLVSGLVSTDQLQTILANYYTKQEVDTLLNGKVDKVQGKGLSTEDFTTEEKTKLAGIEAEANKTIIDNELNNISENPVQNKVIYEALSEKQTEINNLQTDVEDLRNASVKVSGSGTNFNLSNTAKARFIELFMKGNTYQQTYTGANKLNINYLPISDSESTLNGGSYNFDENTGKLSINANNATNTVTIRSRYINNSTFVLPAGSYYSQVKLNVKKVSDGTSAQYTDGAITIPEDVYITQWFIACSQGYSKEIYLQINTGSTATSYEPYVGGTASPNPDFPQIIHNVTGNANVKIQNKNLAKEAFDEKLALSGSGTKRLVKSVDKYRGEIIKVKANTTYVVSGDFSVMDNSNIRIGFFDEYPVVDTVSTDFVYGTSPFTFTTGANTKYIFLYNSANVDTVVNNLQLEQGTTATSYVEHQEQNYPFTFAENQRGMQGTTLEDDGIHQKRKQIVLDGTENWRKHSTIESWFYLDSIEDAYTNNNEDNFALCNEYIQEKYTNSAILENNKFVLGKPETSIIRLAIKNTDYLTIEEWKAYLAEQYANGTPVIVEYELAESELENNIIPYNATQQTQYNNIKANASSYDDITIISSESDELGFNMNVVAVADANKVIDSELQEIKSAVIALGGDINV